MTHCIFGLLCLFFGTPGLACCRIPPLWLATILLFRLLYLCCYCLYSCISNSSTLLTRPFPHGSHSTDSPTPCFCPDSLLFHILLFFLLSLRFLQGGHDDLQTCHVHSSHIRVIFIFRSINLVDAEDVWDRQAIL